MIIRKQNNEQPRNGGKYWILLLLLDITILTLLYNLFHYLRLNSFVDHSSIPYIGVVLIVITALYVADTYERLNTRGSGWLAVRAVVGVSTAGLFSTVFVYLVGPEQFTSAFGRGVLPVTLLCFGIWVMVSRTLVPVIFPAGGFENYWLYVGGYEKFQQLQEEFPFPEGSVNVYTDEVPSNDAGSPDVVIAGGIEDLETLQSGPWKEAIVATDRPLNDNFVSAIMALRQSGVRVFDLNSFYEKYLVKVPVLQLDRGWFIQGGSFSLLHNQAGVRVKRILDHLLSIVILVLCLPVLIIVGMLIKITSPGPVFYRQERVGLNGKAFRIIKFRTMIEDAEQDGAKWAEEQDPRITSVGQVLRKLRIDELPQLVNVMRGEMSFIGPRPERPEFVSRLEHEIPYYEFRHLIMPGITGWAQVMYAYGASTEDARQKLQYDLYYIKHYSLALDFLILLKTFRTVFLGRGR